MRRGEVAERPGAEGGGGVEHHLDVGRRRRGEGLAVGADASRRGRVADGLVLDVGRCGVLELCRFSFLRGERGQERRGEVW